MKTFQYKSTYSTKLPLTIVLLLALSQFSIAASQDRKITSNKAYVAQKVKIKHNGSSLAVLKRKSIQGANGSSAYRQSFKGIGDNGGVYKRNSTAHANKNGSHTYRVAETGKKSEDEYWRKVEKHRETSKGGTIDKSRTLSGSKDKELIYTKSVEGESAKGNKYSGSVVIENGEITRSHNCSDSSGAAIDCR